MLWYKGWLETRWRLVFALAFLFALPTVRYVSHSRSGEVEAVDPPQVTQARNAAILNIWVAFWIMPPLMLGADGIKTQSPFQSRKGFHGSRDFTLAMPVSRVRLVLVRAGVGLLELAATTLVGSLGVAILLPVLGVHPATKQILEYAAAVFTCTTSVYFLVVLLATVLDEMWTFWGAVIAMGLFFGLVRTVPLLRFADIFHAMGDASPLLTNTLPWATMGASLVVSALLLFAALRIVQTREY